MIINSILVTADNIWMINGTPIGTPPPPPPVAGLYCWLPRRTVAQKNSMVSSWGLLEGGRMWFNTTTKQVEMWDGNNVRVMG